MTLTRRSTPTGRRVPRVLVALAGTAIAVLSVAGPASASPAAPATPRTPADNGYLVLCTGNSYPSGN
jgi:hypothetical protein